MPDADAPRLNRRLAGAIRHGLLTALVTLFPACASAPLLVDHAFGFDLRHDGQRAEVLDYRYGDSQLPVQAPAAAVAAGKTFAFAGVHGPMRRGETLYVKWRDLASGQVHADTVDLRTRLPADLRDHTLYFLIRGAQLVVYLVSPRAEPRAATSPADGPGLYRERNVVQIYPDR